MEIINNLDKKNKDFLSLLKDNDFLSTEIVDNYGYDFSDGSGNGSGYGSGYGSGSGSGYGSGSGSGNGSGNGSGYGSAYGSFYGSGGDEPLYNTGDGLINSIKKINNLQVVSIDNIHTIIENIHGNYAKGYILNEDLSTTPCFIAKYGDYFAHGKTLAEAIKDAQAKYEENLPIEERIMLFNEKYPSNDKLIDGNELFDYHHILTGSCLLGRESFCQERGLDLNSKYTVREFIAITEDAYGNEVIKKLKESRGL